MKIKQKWLKKTLTVSITMTLTLSLFSCSSSAQSDVIAPKNKDTFVRDNSSEPETLDPHRAQTDTAHNIINDLFEGLMTEDQSNKPIPGIAKSYKISQDGKTYTFYLRNNAKWSNGEPLTAHDFVYSFRRAVTPKTAAPFTFMLEPIVNAKAIIKGKKDPSTLGVKAIDNHTLEIQLNKPTYYFLSVLTTPIAMPVNQKTIEQYGDSAYQTTEHWVSDGPYQLKERVVNGYILVEKNPYYYDAKHVQIKKVKFLPMVDSTVAYNAYLSGNVDYLYAPASESIALMKKNHPNEVYMTPYISLQYLDFNFNKPPFKDNLKLRQALSLVIDRKTLVDKVVKNDGRPAYKLFPEGIDQGIYDQISYHWRNWPIEKRIKAAQKLYKEAGYSKEKPLKLQLVYNTDNGLKDMMQSIASTWKQTLGVETSLENSEWKVFIYTRNSHDYQGLARDAWIADYNAISNFAQLYQCDNINNNAAYCNKKYDQLIEQAANSVDPKNRQALYSKAMELAMNDYPVIPLYDGSFIVYLKPYVKGFDITNNHMGQLHDKWLYFDYGNDNNKA